MARAGRGTLTYGYQVLRMHPAPWLPLADMSALRLLWLARRSVVVFRGQHVGGQGFAANAREQAFAMHGCMAVARHPGGYLVPWRLSQAHPHGH